MKAENRFEQVNKLSKVHKLQTTLLKSFSSVEAFFSCSVISIFYASVDTNIFLLS